MNSSGRSLRAFVLALATVASAGLVPCAASAEDSPPAVARLSVVRGSVAVQHAGSTDAVAAAVNAPVLTGDYLSSGADGRTEVQFDGTSSLRIAQNAQLHFRSLESGHREIQLAQGTVELRLFRSAAGYRLDTPSVSVILDQAGSYRVGVNPEGRSEITARSGRATVATPGGSFTLLPGKTMLARGTAANPSIEFSSAVAADDFDRFNDSRDAEAGRAVAYVDPAVSGGSDLSAYGRWISAPGYGTVWAPYASSGWAPYRNGSWVSLPYYGWNWVSSEPWGWAPYHYGRWFYNGPAGWCWYPGDGLSPWEPALVAFIGVGGFGSVGWFPLGPYDPFFPWWGSGPTVVVNTYTTVVNYQNGRVPNVVSGTPTRRFLLGQFDHVGTIARKELSRATVVHGPLPLEPGVANRGNRRVTPAVTVRTELIQQAFSVPRNAASPHAFATGRFDGSRAATAPWSPAAPVRGQSAPAVAPPAYHPPAVAQMPPRNYTPPAPVAPAAAANSSQTTTRAR